MADNLGMSHFSGYIFNPQVNWVKSKKIVAVYLDFDFYFFKNKTTQWFLSIALNKKLRNNIPISFLKMLEDRNILVYAPSKRI